MKSLLSQALVAAYDAGQAILRLYEGSVAVQYKEDRSPLTEADCASHQIIVSQLQQVDASVPVLSEAVMVRRWKETPLSGVTTTMA